MVENDGEEKLQQEPEAITWADFLQECPPGEIRRVSGVISWLESPHSRDPYPSLEGPELRLHCPSGTCSGFRFFNTGDGGTLYTKGGERTYRFLQYTCRNCLAFTRTFAVAVLFGQKHIDTAQVHKLGEYPAYGPPVPSRVLRLVQEDRELFLSGRRCENQGLGIGAFSYYRRVVENHWERLVDHIIKVAQRVGASESIIENLNLVRDQNQFKKAVKDGKEAIPESLLINGHNPLLLLHIALSKGIHTLSDGECLELATNIRLVLVELAEKLAQALKEEKELSDAVKRLMNRASQQNNENNPQDNEKGGQ